MTIRHYSVAEVEKLSVAPPLGGRFVMQRYPFLTALCAGLAAGIAYPLVDVAVACREPMSEACVWGKAYLPLTLGVSVVILGGAVTGLVYAVIWWKIKRRSGDQE